MRHLQLHRAGNITRLYGKGSAYILRVARTTSRRFPIASPSERQTTMITASAYIAYRQYCAAVLAATRPDCREGVTCMVAPHHRGARRRPGRSDVVCGKGAHSDGVDAAGSGGRCARLRRSSGKPGHFSPVWAVGAARPQSNPRIRGEGPEVPGATMADRARSRARNRKIRAANRLAAETPDGRIRRLDSKRAARRRASGAVETRDAARRVSGGIGFLRATGSFARGVRKSQVSLRDPRNGARREESRRRGAWRKPGRASGEAGSRNPGRRRAYGCARYGWFYPCPLSRCMRSLRKIPNMGAPTAPERRAMNGCGSAPFAKGDRLPGRYLPARGAGVSGQSLAQNTRMGDKRRRRGATRQAVLGRATSYLRTRPVLPPPPVVPPPDPPCDMMGGATRALAFERATGSCALGTCSLCGATRLAAPYIREGMADGESVACATWERMGSIQR